MKTHDLICEIKLTVNSEKFGKKRNISNYGDHNLHVGSMTCRNSFFLITKPLKKKKKHNLNFVFCQNTFID